MKPPLTALMLGNAALFVFGALQRIPGRSIRLRDRDPCFYTSTRIQWIRVLIGGLHGILVGVVATLLTWGSLWLALSHRVSRGSRFENIGRCRRRCLRGMATSAYERYRCGITLKLRLCARRNSFRIADNLPGMTRSAHSASGQSFPAIAR
jgi:hypothetical protein